jgi:hypothetical protein
MAPAFLTRLLRALRIRRDGRGAAPARENPRPESERLWLALEAGAIGTFDADLVAGETR